MNMTLFPDHFFQIVIFFYNFANIFAKPPTFFESVFFMISQRFFLKSQLWNIKILN